MSVGGVRRVVDRALEWLLVFVVDGPQRLVAGCDAVLLRNPSSFTEEIARYLLVWVGILGGAYAVGKRIHLAIDLLPTKLEGRRKAMLELFIEVCIFVLRPWSSCLAVGSGVADPDLGRPRRRCRFPWASFIWCCRCPGFS